MGKWLLKISYSWNDEEPDQQFESFEEAWKEAKKLAINEAEVVNVEHECKIPIDFEIEDDKHRIILHYPWDDACCYYDVVKF